MQAVTALSTTMDLRFPGQWFQLETGLHYNWRRHYDATTGRYLQLDPWVCLRQFEYFFAHYKDLEPGK